MTDKRLGMTEKQRTILIWALFIAFGAVCGWIIGDLML